MRKKRAKQLQELSFKLYKADSEGFNSHTNAYRRAKKFYTTAKPGVSRALKLKALFNLANK